MMAIRATRILERSLFDVQQRPQTADVGDCPVSGTAISKAEQASKRVESDGGHGALDK